MLCDKKHSHVQWRDFKMNVLVCDDDQQIVDSIIEELKKKSEETHVALRFYGFSQPSQIDLSLPYDIALLDIDMGETNGIELARKLRAENENIVIIFITNFIQYAPEGFEVQAFRYLLKADFSAKLDSYFDSAVQEVLQRKQLVTISINSEIIDVPVNDILYLESHRRIIVMHLLDEKRPAYQFYGNITELSEKIEPLGFLRIQKSYLVNMHYVEIFQYNKVQLRGGLCLAPSEKNYNELKQKYLHWRGKSRYSIEKRVTTLFTWLVQCLIGGFCFGWTLTISFSVFFLLIRKYTNGYHAATYSKCLFCSILLEVVLLASISYVFRTGLALLFLTIVSDATILCIAPVNNKSIHWSTDEFKAAKIAVRWLLLILNIFAILLVEVQIAPSILQGLVAALTADAITLSISRCQN